MENDIEEETRQLAKRAKRIEIDDQDVGKWDTVVSAFSEHLQTIESGTFIHPNSNKSGNKPRNPLTTVFSEISHNEESIVCGLTNAEILTIDPGNLSHSLSDSIANPRRKHCGLSCIRCSRTNAHTFFSGSDVEGNILLWDTRESAVKASQRFDVNASSVKGSEAGSSSGSLLKPILSLDVSCNDQLICGGTELSNDDSYLFFWDIRSHKLLGAYWESHSDDVTAVKFHPTQPHTLASGSTDGLLNVFNLLETEEDDALLFSFNTESSVDSIHWNNVGSGSTSNLSCLTHTNDLHIWDTESGDIVTKFSRTAIAEAMMRSNPDAAHVNGCYTTDQGSTGLLTCSLSGECARLLDLTGNELKPKSLFLDQSAVIQTAQFLTKNKRWVTFDEDGCVKLWAATPKQTDNVQHAAAGGKSKRRFQPYTRDKHVKNK